MSINGADDSEWRLYDMETDRAELHDLAPTMPDQVEAMKRRWFAWARQTNVLPWPKDRPK